MKKIFLMLLAIFLISGHSYGVEDDYLDIGLTRPIKLKESVNLSSITGFTIHSEDGLVLGNIDENNIKVDFRQGTFSVFSSDGLLLQNYNKNFMLAPKISVDGNIKVEEMAYRGYIKFKNFNGSPLVINRIRLEDYLKGVVPSEIGPSSPEEALRAQAIASRSFAISNINKMSSKGYNMDDTTACQAYFGIQKEDPRSNKAVEDTRGLVARYNGEVANTIFFSTSSGITENIRDVWGGSSPYLVSVEDPYSSGSANYNWEITINKQDLQDVLVKNNKDVGEIRNATLDINPNTGSVQNVNFYGSRGEASIKAANFRTALGSTKFKSTWFRIGEDSGDLDQYKSVKSLNKNEDIHMMSAKEKKADRGNKKFVIGGADSKTIVIVKRARIHNRSKTEEESSTIDVFQPPTYDKLSYKLGDTIKFRGRGYGHGVGMPQAGARGMANAGFGYEDILKYYFKGVEIGK